MSFKVVIPARYNSTRLPGKPLIEIGKILETDFYEDEKKNLYYRDFPDSSKLNEDSIYPHHSQERGFWVIKDGYTVNLSVVNWIN